ncbi:hypothetical protein MSAN_01729200 [Mycena sanguinolenta]|uniref:GATA-type domain-containing protein n=1 Tax=Mycena sanguinolenta TaxID=230812 RepID=A0A8H6XZ32_9AGAR|nr:hypothetical protein MSAN_01729200 [Mycena sanguinolenta]
MDAHMHALTWSSTHQQQSHPVVDESSAPPSTDDDTHAPPGVAHSDGGFIQPGQVQNPTQSVLPPGYTTARGYQYSGVGAHDARFTSIPPLRPNAPTSPFHPPSHYAHEHPDVAAAPRDRMRYSTNVTPPDSSYSSNERLDHQYGGMGGPNALPTTPFPSGSDHAHTPGDFATRYSFDGVHDRVISQRPSVQYPFNSSSLPPISDAPTLLRRLTANLRETHLREVWRYMASQTEDDFVVSVREAGRLDPRRPHTDHPFPQNIPSHSPRSSTRTPTITTVDHGAEGFPALPQSQAYGMSRSSWDSTSPPRHNRDYHPSLNDATHVSPPSFTDPNCVPQHDAEQQRYLFSYHTDVSPFPQTVVGPYPHSSQNHSLRSPLHPSAPNAPTPLPAPGASSLVSNPKKKSKSGLCAMCQKTETSQWRRHPVTADQLCNYCGQKAHATTKVPKT